MVHTDRYLINSVLRAAQILQAFSFNETAMTNAQLSRRLGLNRSTVTRLLYSLEKAGFLERDAKTGEYRLTHALYRIGSVYISQVNLHREAMPLLSELVSSCRETVHLATLHESDVFFIDRVKSTRSIVSRSFAGSTLPAYCTATGKVLLAYLSKEDLDSFLNKIKLEPFTPNTITDKDELRAQLETIRERGYAIDDIEHEKEIKSLACPVRDNSGHVIAGVSIAGPVYRMTDERIKNELAPLLIEATRKISARLGYQRGIADRAA